MLVIHVQRVFQKFHVWLCESQEKSLLWKKELSLEKYVKRFKWNYDVDFQRKKLNMEDMIENFIQNSERKIFKNQYVFAISEEIILEEKIEESLERNKR